MQLGTAQERGTTGEGSRSIRGRLGAAACVLLASGARALAQGTDAGPTSQLDITGLYYGESGRVTVTEPMARFTRLYPDGHSWFAQLVIDSISGASPSGGVPTGQTQTTTTASGHVTTSSASEIPLKTFADTRMALDGSWHFAPIGRTATDLGGHFSRERDYQSIGVNGKFSFDFDQRLTTLTLGAGYNQDEVFPVGGTTGQLTDPSVIVGDGANGKHVATVMIGVSRILTRKWMMGFNASRTYEQGYLTEPYKILSVVDPLTGYPVSELTDKRPDTRSRTSVLVNSVNHLTRDVVYSSYRYYRDDWSVRSHTFDFKYRHDIEGTDVYVEPHVRYYTQTGASFFRSQLVAGAPLPEFATSDYRLGSMQSYTLGATLGFRPPGSEGDWSVRVEYFGQFGNSHPSDAVGVQRDFDLYPPLNTLSFVVGYSRNF